MVYVTYFAFIYFENAIVKEFLKLAFVNKAVKAFKGLIQNRRASVTNAVIKLKYKLVNFGLLKKFRENMSAEML